MSMADLNPYQSPSHSTELLDRFDLDLLPLSFRISQAWAFYWSGMLILATVSCVLASSSLVRFPENATFLTYIGPLPPLFMIGLCLRSLTNQIEISRSGIRVNRLRRVIPWSAVHSWKIGKYDAPTLILADGRELGVVGPATSVSRNEIIQEALTHFVGNTNPPNAG